MEIGRQKEEKIREGVDREGGIEGERSTYLHCEALFSVAEGEAITLSSPELIELPYSGRDIPCGTASTRYTLHVTCFLLPYTE